MPYCVDSGADISVISKTKLAELMAKDSVVRPVELNEEVDVKTAGGHFLRAKDYVEVRLQNNTAAYPVCLTTPVKCLIIDEEENEFINGKDVLATLGIDVDLQIEQLEQLVIHGFIDDEDPIDCDDDVEIGVECDTDVRAAVEELLDKAIENGFPRERRGELLTIALMYDIWRLRLGGYPPAKVPPLLIKLRDGAKPQKCKARQYPPQLREFCGICRAGAHGLGLRNPAESMGQPCIACTQAGLRRISPDM